GSMTTLHANSARDTLTRLESMLSMGGFDMPVRVLRDYVASAIDVVVHLARLPDGRRVVSEVVEVQESPEGLIRTETLHRYRLETVQQGRVIGGFEATGIAPQFLTTLRARGCEPSVSLFTAGPLTGAGA
ncbi:MAG: CpaF family protein, partial [Planctomycetota bacterium]